MREFIKTVKAGPAGPAFTVFINYLISNFTYHMNHHNHLHGNTELVHHTLLHLMNMECVQTPLMGTDKNKHELLLFGS